jgi:predicted phosphoribosyltransferase
VPRGGVVTGAVLARELGAELDVALSRKIGAPFQPEYAIGAVAEDGGLVLNPDAREAPGVTAAYLEAARREQLEEIGRRQQLVRAVRPAARVAGRSVIVTDDGVATGSTVLAALRTVREQRPHELILAVPVAPPDRLPDLAKHCDEVVCLLAPEDFHAVGQFYDDFSPVEDDEVLRLLKEQREAASGFKSTAGG